MPGSAPRAEQARKVLDWCRHALQELRQQPTGMAWIVRWAGALALLRAVGDTLGRVDIQGNPALCEARRKWKVREKPESQEIFERFIRGDTNCLLHQAEVRAGQSVSVVAPSASARATAYGEDRRPTETAAPPVPPPIYTYHMNGGPFHDRDPRDIVQEAIDWWQQQIDAIEADAAQLRQSGTDRGG
jgi:hypothetical protein